MTESGITALLLDIGGVLLTNGWDRRCRRRACEKFSLDFNEIDERHAMTFDTYEGGNLSLDTYLDRTIFFTPRPFGRDEFKAFMFDQSSPDEEMLALIRGLKTRYGLKTVAVNNEGRELSEYRIRKFRLDRLIDTFISSCFVHRRKPDEEIYRMALDIAQVRPEQALYLEDRALLVEVAQGLGIHAILHRDAHATRRQLAEDWGLSLA
jgi:putative hydrolase of the HAD superfamily